MRGDERRIEENVGVEAVKRPTGGIFVQVSTFDKSRWRCGRKRPCRGARARVDSLASYESVVCGCSALIE
jgi:hypothetical protein